MLSFSVDDPETVRLLSLFVSVCLHAEGRRGSHHVTVGLRQACPPTVTLTQVHPPTVPLSRTDTLF